MQTMSKQQNHEASEHRRHPQAVSEEVRPSRGQVLQRIKLELVTTAGLGLDDHSRGSDPYNNRLGVSPRDAWSRRPRA